MRIPLVISVALTCASWVAYSAELTPGQGAKLEAHLAKVRTKGQIDDRFVTTAIPSRPGGPISFAALYTHEDPSGAGGNYYVQRLVVFGHSSSEPLAIVTAGGKGYRSASLLDATGFRVDLDLLLYDSDDAQCCPSVKARTSYSLRDGVFEESSLRVAPN